MPRARVAAAAVLLALAALIIPARGRAATETRAVQAQDIGWGVASPATTEPAPAKTTAKDIGWG